MNILDYILVFGLLIGLVQGFRKGFINQLGGLLAIVVAVFITFKFWGITKGYLAEQDIVSDKFLGIAAIGLTFVLGYYGVNLVSNLLEKVVKTIGLGIVNRIAGAGLGLLIHAVVLGAVLYFAYPWITNLFPDFIAESKYGELVYTTVKEFSVKFNF